MIENQFQFENTQAKRAELQQLVDQKRKEGSDSYASELTLRSLKRRINQLTEEMVRYESQHLSKPAHR